MVGLTENRSSSEAQKVRCREAARYRRDQERELFAELACQLPLPHHITIHLQKASVLRLTISLLHLRHLLLTGDNEQGPGCLLGLSSELDSLLDGFLLLLSQSGKVTFTGENVHRYLGLTQLELMGQNIFDFVHPYDQRELQEALMFKQVDGQKTNRRESRDFFIRVKCTVTNDSKMVNLRLASWKVLHCSGFFWTPQGNRRVDTGPYLILICDPIPFPLNLEPSAKGQSFLTYHSLDMKFIYCDSRVKDLIGFDADQLVGHSIYSFIHTFDLSHIWKRHFSLLKMGQISSGLYRMLHYFGGYIWVKTEATLVYENQNTRSPFVICNNYILSRPEQEEILFSIEQTKSDTGGRGLPTATVLPRDAKCAHIGPRHRLEQQGHQPCEVSETEALEVGISGMQWSYQHHNLQHPLSSTDAVPQSQRLAFENSRLLGLASGAALTNPTLTSFRNMTLRPSTLFSAASSSNLTEEWFADHNLENLAPFIPMEDEEFQMIPVENSWLRAVPGYQTLHHRGNCETARFSSSSVCELSLRRGIKRNHQTDLTCDLAVCLCKDGCCDAEWQGPFQQKRLKTLNVLDTEEQSCHRENLSLWDWRTDLSSCLQGSCSSLKVLPILSPIDCEVNAPLHGARLLHGTDLLQVLDQASLYQESKDLPNPSHRK